MHTVIVERDVAGLAPNERPRSIEVVLQLVRSLTHSCWINEWTKEAIHVAFQLKTYHLLHNVTKGAVHQISWVILDPST